MFRNFSLFFIRHGKLLLPYKDHSEMPFTALANLASGKIDPPIDKSFIKSLITQISSVIPFKNLKKIYTSPSRRCLETAMVVRDFINQKFHRKPKVIINQELKEIRFDLKKFVF
jgi:broad specificity phosphatase PhoE